MLWPWRRPGATAPIRIRLLAWEPPYVEGAALEKTKKKKKTNKYTEPGLLLLMLLLDKVVKEKDELRDSNS